MKVKNSQKLNISMATHFPSMSNRVDVNLNVQWFSQDINLGVMPIGGRTHHKNFAVELKGIKSDCERAEQLITDLGRDHFYDFSDNVCGAVEHLTWNLSSEGRVAYEIILDENEAIRLVNFTTKRLWRMFGYFLQFIPRSDQERWKKKIATLPDDRVWYFEIPTSLGGRNNYRALLKKLRKFPTLAPDFWRDNIAEELHSEVFNFRIYQNLSEAYWRRATKTWGWNRRDSSTDKTTEFFNYYKLICFARAQAELREYIILELNKLFLRLDSSTDKTTEFFNYYKLICFARAQAELREYIILELNKLFLRLGIKCELQIDGLPTTVTIDQVKREFIAGRVPVDEIFEKVKL